MILLSLFFNPAINGGWNLVAIGFYSIIAMLIFTAYTERKKP